MHKIVRNMGMRQRPEPFRERQRCLHNDRGVGANACMMMLHQRSSRQLPGMTTSQWPHPCSAVKNVLLTNQSGSGLLFCRPDSTNRPSLSDTVMACWPGSTSSVATSPRSPLNDASATLSILHAIMAVRSIGDHL